MSPELTRLITLQRLETTITEARSQVAGHPQRLADFDVRLDAARQAVEAVKHRLKDGQEVRRAAEKDAATFQARLTKFKDQLSAVKTNREYTAMQHEIEMAQHDLGVAEEKVLERMMEGDSLAAELKQSEAALVALQKEIDAEKLQLAEEVASAEVSLAKALEARAALVAQLDARSIALFEQLTRVRRGVAICTATRDGLCSVCHVRLRPQVFQQVRQNDSITQCDTCQRILYYIPPPPPVEPAQIHHP